MQLQLWDKPDELDKIPAHASAAGMIYSFYGRLSVGNMDTEWLKNKLIKHIKKD